MERRYHIGDFLVLTIVVFVLMCVVSTIFTDSKPLTKYRQINITTPYEPFEPLYDFPARVEGLDGRDYLFTDGCGNILNATLHNSNVVYILIPKLAGNITINAYVVNDSAYLINGPVFKTPASWWHIPEKECDVKTSIQAEPFDYRRDCTLLFTDILGNHIKCETEGDGTFYLGLPLGQMPRDLISKELTPEQTRKCFESEIWSECGYTLVHHFNNSNPSLFNTSSCGNVRFTDEDNNTILSPCFFSIRLTDQERKWALDSMRIGESCEIIERAINQTRADLGKTEHFTNENNINENNITVMGVCNFKWKLTKPEIDYILEAGPNKTCDELIKGLNYHQFNSTNITFVYLPNITLNSTPYNGLCPPNSTAKEVECDCAKNTSWSCMAYCYECVQK